MRANPSLRIYVVPPASRLSADTLDIPPQKIAQNAADRESFETAANSVRRQTSIEEPCSSSQEIGALPWFITFCFCFHPRQWHFCFCQLATEQKTR